MRPILIRIRKKTKVPTKNAIIHDFRSDWKLVGKIDYSDSILLFKNIENRGPIETDAQFCNWMYRNFGKGTYSLIAWCKGVKGFWGFGTYELDERGYKRVPRNRTREEKELIEKKQEITDVKRRITLATSEKDKQELREELDFINEIYSNEDFETRHKRGPVPYLKQIQPVYKYHHYEKLYKEDSNEMEVKDFW